MIDQTATRAVAVTPSDTVDLPDFKAANRLADWIYVGGAGNVVVVLQDNSTVTFTAPPVGSFLWIKARRINATNTTATLLLAGYQQ